MDVSPEYILMCEKAAEIQSIAEQLDFDSHGNYYADSITNVHWFDCDCGLLPNRKQDCRYIWLPRQDQLQEMIPIHETVDTVSGKMASILSRFYNWYLNTAYHLTSFEQLWLAFVMHEKYNKVWDGIDWKKLNILI